MDGQRQKTEQQTTIRESDGDDFREMLDLEEELRQQHLESNSGDGFAPESLPTNIFERYVDENIASGTIRVIKPEDNQLSIEFFVEGEQETYTHTISKPDAGEDISSTSLGNLCRLCGVSYRHISELQGERVPVTETNGGYAIQIPETTTLPARLLYRLWWWGRRRPIAMQEVTTTIVLAVTGLFAIGGLRGLFAMVVMQQRNSMPVDEFAAHAIPFVSKGLAASHPEIFTTVGMGMFFTGLFAFLGSLFVFPVVITSFLDHAWPF